MPDAQKIKEHSEFIHRRTLTKIAAKDLTADEAMAALTAAVGNFMAAACQEPAQFERTLRIFTDGVRETWEAIQGPAPKAAWRIFTDGVRETWEAIQGTAPKAA